MDTHSACAKANAVAFEQETPQQVTATMARARRDGRVFIDWIQNNPAKTTFSPYSPRGRDKPTVATPVTWDEVRNCRKLEQLMFTADEVVDRAAELGDIFAPIERDHQIVVPAEHVEVFESVYGWWAWICRNGKLVLAAYGTDLAHESAPNVRPVGRPRRRPHSLNRYLIR